MRPSIALLIVSSSVGSASWVKLPGHRALVGRGSCPPPRETGRSGPDGTKGWTPKPTPAPGAVSESDAVIELLREKRAASSSNTWEDDVTCGWTSGVSSQPFTCAPGFSCRTNDEHVVGCVSGTYSPFFTVCLDMQAFQQGACNSIGPKTGCCQSSGFGACGTFLWTGTPARSMYRCFPQPTIISMNDEPQEVIDASTSTSSTSTTSTSSTSTSSSSGTSTATTTPADSYDKPSSNTGAIVGGVVGGVAVLALLAALAAWLILRGRRPGKTDGSGNNQTYNPVPPSDPTNNPQLSPGQQYAGGYTTLPGGQPTTFPPMSPYPAMAPAYDPRQSYYDAASEANKSPGMVSQAVYTPPHQHQHVFAGQQPPASPPAVTGTGTYDPHRSAVVSELESAAVAGTRGNPVEIGDR